MDDPNLGLVGMEHNTMVLRKSLECRLCLINWTLKLRSNLFNGRGIALVHNAAHDSVMKARVVEGLAVASIARGAVLHLLLFAEKTDRKKKKAARKKPGYDISLHTKPKERMGNLLSTIYIYYDGFKGTTS